MEVTEDWQQQIRLRQLVQHDEEMRGSRQLFGLPVSEDGADTFHGRVLNLFNVHHRGSP